jgi:hypothetical protein
MSRCKATMKWKVTTKGPQVEIACDLDEGHMPVYPRHFDKTIGPTGLEWLPGAEPVPVMSTRTSPNPSQSSRKAKRVASSVTAHTGVFEVVS